MARRRKKYTSSDNTLSSQEENISYNPDEFEDIELPTEPPGEEHNGDSVEDMTSQDVSSLLSAKDHLVDRLLFTQTTQAFSAESGTKMYGFENIVGVGISEKIIDNQFTGRQCVTVYVVAKAGQDQIAPQALVPKAVNGIPTDVVATGELHAFPHRGRYRPSPGGVSVGHYQITAGTLGCLVRRGNALYILSNNHVLANINSGEIGDPILQPGPFDGGQIPNDVIAQLSEYVPILFDGQANVVDCALAQASPSLVTPLSKCFGSISSIPQAAQRFQVVKKCGRSTQLTRGIITDVNATVRVGYGTAGSALFQDQIIILGIPFIAPFSAPGDSGSLVLNEFTNRPAGLLFAGSFTHTIANKIENALSLLNVSIVS